MQIILKEKEKLIVTSEKGAFGGYVVLECLDGTIVNNTSHNRLKPKEPDIKQD